MLEPLTDRPIQTSGAADHALHYVEAGQGPVLLLIHGSLCDLRYWRWQMPAFSRRFRVIAPSLRGYWPRAFTEADPNFNVRRHAADLASLLDESRAGSPVHVLGHSRGARVALELALLEPGRIASLTLADPGLRTTPPSARPDFQKQVAESLAQGDEEAALAAFVDTVNGPGTWRRMTGWFKDMVRDNAGTLLSQAAEAGQIFEPERARALDCPVMLLGGEHSPPRYAQAMDALQAVLPHARRDIVPKAAHGMNLGNAPYFNARIERFLLEQS